MSNAPFSLDPDDPNLIEKANKANDSLNSPEPPAPIAKSSIDRLKELSDSLGVSQIREDVDVLKQNMNRIAESQQELISTVNSIATVFNQQNQGTPQQADQKGINPENAQALVAIVDTLADTWKKIKGPTEQPNQLPGLDPNWIISEAVEAVKDDFSLGRDLRAAIKRNIKGKAVSSVVKNMSNEVAGTHEPE